MIGCVVRHCTLTAAAAADNNITDATHSPVNVYADAPGLATLSRWRYATAGVYDITNTDLALASTACGVGILNVCVVMTYIGRRLGWQVRGRSPHVLWLVGACAVYSCGAGVAIYRMLVSNRDECVSKQRMRVLMQDDDN